MDNGIWNIIDRYKNNYNFLNILYKNENTLNQLLYLFNNNKKFCISYLSNEGCNICLAIKKDNKYLSTLINFDYNYIKMFTIEQLIYFNLKNDKPYP